jgi:arginine/lysine/ornithine decarboxylase
LAAFLPLLEQLKAELKVHGYVLMEEEPLKLTIAVGQYGYSGKEYAAILREQSIVCEFADADYVVMMLTPEIGEAGLKRLADAMMAVEQKKPVISHTPVFRLQKKAMSIRQAAFSPCETVPVEESVGRVLATATVGCPPAVPIVVCGEIIDEAAVACFRYYGIDTCTVVKD